MSWFELHAIARPPRGANLGQARPHRSMIGRASVLQALAAAPDQLHTRGPTDGPDSRMMASDPLLPLACQCGAVRGTLDAARADVACRVLCYCNSCQQFARHLGQDAKLDANGGSDIIQVSAGALEITEGAEQLACLRLTDKGPIRWYARCCKTPIANTPAQHTLPLAGLVASFVAAPDEERDAQLCPVRYRIMAKYAAPGPVEGKHVYPGFPLRQIAALVAAMLRWRLRKAHLHTPFFDGATGEPRVEPEAVRA